MAGKIFVIDDDPQLTSLLKETLCAKGYEVDIVSNGKEGQQLFADSAKLENLKLVILDRLLGDVDGIQLVDEFNQKTQKRVPVLVLSSLSTEKDVLQGLQKGAIEYLTKPFNMEILLEKVAKLAG